MTEFINSLDLIFTFLLNTMSNIFTLYTGQVILIAVFTLWILSRIVDVLNKLKGQK